jgi:hypothetical protein
MAQLEITSRCLNDCLGYCAKNKTGTQVISPNGEISYLGYGAKCEEDWLVCVSHVKFTDIVKPPPKVEEPVKLEENKEMVETPKKSKKVKKDEESK